MTTVAIIREGKLPADKRAPLTPQQCVEVMQKFPGTRIIVQTSPDRCFPDKSYSDAGIPVSDDVSSADILLGVKEVPVEQLIPGKTYLFFSHTIKKQAHNLKLLRAIIKHNIRLVDYETLVWDAGNRIIGFGRFAGIVGAHHALRTWGKRTETFELKPAYRCTDMEAMYAQYTGITIPKVKIALCGDGRVAHGVLEFLRKLKIHHVSQEEFLENEYEEPVYVQLRSEDYYSRKDGREWDKSDFYKHPEDYRIAFAPYYRAADVMINAIFWHEGVPAFFTREEMKGNDFRIRIISDISCDIPGPLPSTLRSTTIEDPYYGYNQFLGKETEPFRKENIDVQAVGNLPCELPVDASIEFGEQLIRHVLPNLLLEDKDHIIRNATITDNGKLTERYGYLKDYVD